MCMQGVWGMESSREPKRKDDVLSTQRRLRGGQNGQ